MARPTAGEKATATKKARYGKQGLADIAAKAYRTRQERQKLRLSALQKHLARVAGSAMSRARRTGKPYEEDLAGWALATMEAQNYKCALSGCPFSLDVFGHGKAPRPFAPSIDRIDATGGYLKGNIRIICWAANSLLGTWGDGPATEIARGISKNADAA